MAAPEALGRYGAKEFTANLAAVSASKDSNKTSGGSAFRCYVALSIRAVEKSRIHVFMSRYIYVVSGDFEGANLKYTGTGGDGTVRIYKAGNYYARITHKDLGWFNSGEKVTATLSAQYTGGSGTTYKASTSASFTAFGAIDMIPPDFAATVDGDTLHHKDIFTDKSGNVTIVNKLCTASEWETPLQQLGKTYRPSSTIFAYGESVLASSSTEDVSATINPTEMLAELYEKYGGFEGYKANLEGWSNATDEYFGDIKEGCLYICVRRRLSWGNADYGGFAEGVANYTAIFDTNTGNVYIYDATGALHKGKPYVFDESGSPKECAVTAFV